jgi:hypothetical protein
MNVLGPSDKVEPEMHVRAADNRSNVLAGCQEPPFPSPSVTDLLETKLRLWAEVLAHVPPSGSAGLQDYLEVQRGMCDCAPDLSQPTYGSANNNGRSDPQFWYVPSNV